MPQLWVAGAPPEIWDLEKRTESEIENRLLLAPRDLKSLLQLCSHNWLQWFGATKALEY